MIIEVTCFNCGRSAKIDTDEWAIHGEKGDRRVSWVDDEDGCHFAFLSREQELKEENGN